MFYKLTLLIYISVISRNVNSQTSCNSNGQPGVCISTSTCSSGGGSSNPANLCPGPDDIQCCTYGSCTSNGMGGTCITTSACSETSGISNPANLCPGPNNIQCCTKSGGGGGEYGSCMSNGKSGTCISTGSCRGNGGISDPANLCPGPDDIQCCVVAGGGGYGSCTSNGNSGTCISTGSCRGNGGISDPANLCPGPDDIPCCVVAGGGGYGSCTSNGKSGTCISTANCRNTGGSSNPANLCPGPNDIQCCTNGGSPPATGTIPTLNPSQSKYARIIAQQAHSQGVGVRGCQVAIATALQESSIRNLANNNVRESFNYPHDGVGSDHDSVGIFQQRPYRSGGTNYGWGTVQECMDPTHAANAFYSALKRVPNWQNLAITVAAQKVQRSAFPDAYAKWVNQATTVCNAAY